MMPAAVHRAARGITTGLSAEATHGRVRWPRNCLWADDYPLKSIQDQKQSLDVINTP